MTLGRLAEIVAAWQRAGQQPQCRDTAFEAAAYGYVGELLQAVTALGEELVQLQSMIPDDEDEGEGP